MNWSIKKYPVFLKCYKSDIKAQKFTVTIFFLFKTKYLLVKNTLGIQKNFHFLSIL